MTGLSYPTYYNRHLYKWPKSCACPRYGDHEWTTPADKKIQRQLCSLAAYRALMGEGYPQMTDVESDLLINFEPQYHYLKCKRIMRMKAEFSKHELGMVHTSRCYKVYWH
jgi:hypothetical protein